MLVYLFNNNVITIIFSNNNVFLENANDTDNVIIIIFNNNVFWRTDFETPDFENVDCCSHRIPFILFLKNILIICYK